MHVVGMQGYRSQHVGFMALASGRISSACTAVRAQRTRYALITAVAEMTVGTLI